MLLAAALAASTCAWAEVVDDFRGAEIDAAKWARSARAPFFTQSGGRLHFPCKAGAADTLVSSATFGPGFFRVAFHDYRSTNVSPAGRGLGSFVGIGLSAGEERVRTIRGDVVDTGYFEANHFRGGRHTVWYHPTQAPSGQLGIHFDGKTVKHYYNASLDPVVGWRRVGPEVTPEWPSAPKLYLTASAGATGCTQASLGAVEHLPAPLPEALAKELDR